MLVACVVDVLHLASLFHVLVAADHALAMAMMALSAVSRACRVQTTL